MSELKKITGPGYFGTLQVQVMPDGKVVLWTEGDGYPTGENLINAMQQSPVQMKKIDALTVVNNYGQQFKFKSICIDIIKNELIIRVGGVV